MEALIVVDVQNDFCTGGALEVPNGEDIVPAANELMEDFDCVVLTQDWHPPGHNSFASSHKGGDPFDAMAMEYGEQVLWPDHCVQGTKGAEFHSDLDTTRADLILRKGFRPNLDSYSGFYENDGKTSTGLAAYLNARSVHRVYVVGLATDFCVKWTAKDAHHEGFDTHVFEDATKGLQNSDEALRELEQMGVEILSM